MIILRTTEVFVKPRGCLKVLVISAFGYLRHFGNLGKLDPSPLILGLGVIGNKQKLSALNFVSMRRYSSLKAKLLLLWGIRDTTIVLETWSHGPLNRGLQLLSFAYNEVLVKIKGSLKMMLYLFWVI